MGEYPSDPPSNNNAKSTKSITDTEWEALDLLATHPTVTFIGRMYDMGRPATYFTTEEGTFMITVSRVSKAVLARAIPGGDGS